MILYTKLNQRVNIKLRVKSSCSLLDLQGALCKEMGSLAEAVRSRGSSILTYGKEPRVVLPI